MRIRDIQTEEKAPKGKNYVVPAEVDSKDAQGDTVKINISQFMMHGEDSIRIKADGGQIVEIKAILGATINGKKYYTLTAESL